MYPAGFPGRSSLENLFPKATVSVRWIEPSDRGSRTTRRFTSGADRSETDGNRVRVLGGTPDRTAFASRPVTLLDPRSSDAMTRDFRDETRGTPREFREEDRMKPTIAPAGITVGTVRTVRGDRATVERTEDHDNLTGVL